MKSVLSEVMDYSLYTEAGEPIDAVFGAQSITNRKVLSAFKIGTTSTLLKVFAKEAVKLYRE